MNLDLPSSKLLNKGFTLVELLVVVAVVGVLAGTAVLVVNPVEQFNRARDGQRKTEIDSLAKALAAYQASNNNNYPAVGSALTALKTEGSIIKNDPSVISGTATSCSNILAGEGISTPASPTYCYKVNGSNQAEVYTRLQAKNASQQCSPTTLIPYYVWRSSTEKFTVDCLASGTDPAP